VILVCIDDLDTCINEILLDKTKIDILAYIYNKKSASQEDIINDLKFHNCQHKLIYLQNCGLLTMNNDNCCLTKNGKVLAYGLKEWDIELNNNNANSILKNLNLSNNSVILDIGCGSGQFLRATYKYNIKFALGIDINKLSIHLAKHMLGYLNPSASFLLMGNAENLPLRDGTFDLVICRLVLPYTRNEKTVSEISRVLSKGGKVYLRLHGIGYYLNALKGAFCEKNIPYFIYCIFVILNGFILYTVGRQLTIDKTLIIRGSSRNELFCETFQTLRYIEKLLKKNGLTILTCNINRNGLLNLPYTMEVISIKY
jgi:SAM-dependent methyltransferase